MSDSFAAPDGLVRHALRPNTGGGAAARCASGGEVGSTGAPGPPLTRAALREELDAFTASLVQILVGELTGAYRSVGHPPRAHLLPPLAPRDGAFAVVPTDSGMDGELPTRPMKSSRVVRLCHTLDPDFQKDSMVHRFNERVRSIAKPSRSSGNRKVVRPDVPKAEAFNDPRCIISDLAPSAHPVAADGGQESGNTQPPSARSTPSLADALPTPICPFACSDQHGRPQLMEAPEVPEALPTPGRQAVPRVVLCGLDWTLNPRGALGSRRCGSGTATRPDGRGHGVAATDAWDEDDDPTASGRHASKRKATPGLAAPELVQVHPPGCLGIPDGQRRPVATEAVPQLAAEPAGEPALAGLEAKLPRILGRSADRAAPRKLSCGVPRSGEAPDSGRSWSKPSATNDTCLTAEEHGGHAQSAGSCTPVVRSGGLRSPVEDKRGVACSSIQQEAARLEHGLSDGSLASSQLPACHRAQAATDGAEAALRFHPVRQRRKTPLHRSNALRRSPLTIAKDFVLGQKFDYLVTLVIITNSCVIGLQTDHMARNVEDDQTPFAFRVLDNLFCTIFCLELLLRFWAHGVSPLLFGASWRWTIFDTLVLLAQVVQIAQESIVANSSDPRNLDGDGMLSFMQVLRVLRLLRILRVLRLIRFLEDLRAYLSSIVSSMKSLFWAAVLLLLMLYCVAILFTQVVMEHRLDSRGLDEDAGGDVDPLLVMHFGSLGSSVLSLYQAILGGIDWDELTEPLMQSISPVWAMVFAAYVAFAVICMVNVFTGLFVQSALAQAKHDKNAMILDHLSSVLVHGTGATGDRLINREDFEACSSDPKMMQYFTAIDVDPSEACHIFQLLDGQGQGSIPADELLSGCLRLFGPAKAIDVHSLMYEMRQVSRRTRSLELQLGALSYSFTTHSDEARVPLSQAPAHAKGEGA